MRTLLTLIWLSLYSLVLPAQAAILSLSGPQEVAVNDSFALHLHMGKDIDHELIGGFDIDILYDARLLHWTGYRLGNELADPVWGQLDLSRGLISPGVVNVAEVATLPDLSGQPEAFILATLDFKAIAPGDSTVGFFIHSVSTEGGWYVNEWGAFMMDLKITRTGPVDPTVPVVPPDPVGPHPVSLPGTFTLLGLGLFLLWAVRRAPRQFMAALLAITLLPPPGHALERVEYYHNDPLGSPIAATAEDGTLLWRERYQPYGNRDLHDAPARQRLWFTGKAEEAFLGLQDFGARWYDPYSGRFISPDPVGFVESNLQSFNKYAYANNNPYRYVDPDGRNPFAIVYYIGAWMLGGAAVSGGTNAAMQYAVTGEVQWQGIGGVMDAAGDGVILGPVLGGAALATRSGLPAASLTGRLGVANSVTRWGPATGAGPLGKEVAATFRGGSYTEMVTQEA